MKKQRETIILEMLSREKRIEVSTLSEALGVSQVTVRKDLDELERKHMIKRVHGYAQLCSPDDINGRLAYHYEEKMRIAQSAAALVGDGDTIMIESGSCCALTALLISQQRKNVTIITNSAFIADFIRSNSNQVQTILLGGIYQNDAQVMVGPLVRQCTSSFCVDLLFIGTDGYSSSRGFTNCDQMRAQAVRDMAESAQRLVILTESEKFGHTGVVPLGVMDQVSMVITDEKISRSIRDELTKKGIRIITGNE